MIARATAWGRAHRVQQRAMRMAWKLAHPETWRQMQRENYRRYADRRRAYQQERMRQHPERQVAYNAVRDALRRGDLVRRPCGVCGRRGDAHHEDYAQPLLVVWFCPRHHRLWHLEMEPWLIPRW